MSTELNHKTISSGLMYVMKWYYKYPVHINFPTYSDFDINLSTLGSYNSVPNCSNNSIYCSNLL